MNTDIVPIKKYLGFFVLIYIVAIIAMLTVMAIFDMAFSLSLSVPPLLAAGVTAAMKFIKDHQRPPNHEEKHSLILGCLLLAMLTPLIGLALLLIFGANPEITQRILSNPAGIFIGFIIIGGIFAAVFYGLLFIIFGWFSKKQAEKISAATR